MKKNPFLFLLLIISVADLNAQEFRTDESVARQLKNNNQPGIKYAPVAQPPANSSKGFTGSSLLKEIKEGKHGPLQAGPSSAPAARVSNSPAGDPASLPSSRSVEEIKNEIKNAKMPAPPLPPMQEEKNGAVTEPKTLPVKKARQ